MFFLVLLNPRTTDPPTKRLAGSIIILEMLDNRYMMHVHHRFTKSRLHHRLLHCYLYKDLKIYKTQTPSHTSKIFSKLIIKTAKIAFLKHFFSVNFEYVFVSWGNFWSNNSEEFWEMTLFTRSGIFKEINDEVPS